MFELNEMGTMLAMAPMPNENGTEAPGNFYYLGLMVLMMAIFWVVLIRPQRRREQARKDLVSNIKSGDRVVFSGGILGTVANVKDNVFVIKIADKVKIEVSRGAVSHVLEKGEAPPDPHQT